MMKKLSAVLLLSTSILACTQQPVKVKPGALVDNQLHLCVQFDESIAIDDRNAIEEGINVFINNYNTQNKDIRLQNCHTTGEKSLTLHVKKVKNIGPVGQAVYTLISVAGIAYPLSGGSLGWVLLGANSSETAVTLSQDISDTTEVIERNVHSLPYFGSENAQRQRQVHSIQEMLGNILNEVDESNRGIIKG